MADTNLQTAALKKTQLQQDEESQAESSNSQFIKAKLLRFLSYFSGDMAPFGKWMKGRLKQVVPVFYIVFLKCI